MHLVFLFVQKSFLVLAAVFMCLTSAPMEQICGIE